MSRNIASWTVLLVPLALAGFAAGEESGNSPSAGKATYRMYCQNCHGDGGQGDGYIAETLHRRPSDLTQLATGNGGVFPADKVAATIDGREEVKAHGSREMPLWGDVFLWPEGDSPERREVVKRKIGDLVAYLATLQPAGGQH